MNSYDVALIGSGGPLSSLLQRALLEKGVRTLAIGRSIPLLGIAHVPLDLRQLPSVCKTKSHAKTTIFLAAVKGRFIKGSPEWQNQGLVSAPIFDDLFHQIGLTTERLLSVGSSEEYGPRATAELIHEADQCLPVSSYGYWKLEQYKNAVTWSIRNHKPIIHLRPFNIFGPGADANMFIGSLIQALLRGEDFPMTAGEQWRSFLSDQTFMRCILALVDATAWGTYQKASALNVSESNYLQLKDVATRLQILIPTGLLKIGSLKYREDEIWHQRPDLELM